MNPTVPNPAPPKPERALAAAVPRRLTDGASA
ncbi:hypothetical protein GGQ54_000361 [Naumannella cuiyingiana]|uniref:Uncharacterized protein n=1 Tax=Naumannella cuiyingiana TaxID=1347891 RepID=A0A7Z0IJU0_9ACTN|nr:hypothetical protein [Naumannella cuiyingiana]